MHVLTSQTLIARVHAIPLGDWAALRDTLADVITYVDQHKTTGGGTANDTPDGDPPPSQDGKHADGPATHKHSET